MHNTHTPFVYLLLLFSRDNMQNQEEKEIIFLRLI